MNFLNVIENSKPCLLLNLDKPTQELQNLYLNSHVIFATLIAPTLMRITHLLGAVALSGNISKVSAEEKESLSMGGLR